MTQFLYQVSYVAFWKSIHIRITELIKKENISINVDLHEASPEYTTVNAMVTHEDALRYVREDGEESRKTVLDERELEILKALLVSLTL